MRYFDSAALRSARPEQAPPDLLRLLDKKIATSGWGLYPLVAASVQRARYLSDLGRAAAAATPILPQGNCRSYGDACLYERVVSTLPLKHLLAFDSQRGLLRAQAGITFAEIIRFALPQGFFPPVTPGTKFPTLGGCIAADVHGKNHHSEGSVAAFVESLDMVLADGSLVRCSRNECADLFWATLGGMGLTGFIYAATLRLKKVPSAYIRQRAIKTANWAETCRVCTETQHRVHLFGCVDRRAANGSEARARPRAVRGTRRRARAQGQVALCHPRRWPLGRAVFLARRRAQCQVAEGV